MIVTAMPVTIGAAILFLFFHCFYILFIDQTKYETTEISFCIFPECKWACKQTTHTLLSIILFIICPLLGIALIAMKYFSLNTK
jgi:hypothetical protein